MKSTPYYFLSLLVASAHIVGTSPVNAQDSGAPSDLQVMNENLLDEPEVSASERARAGSDVTTEQRRPSTGKEALGSTAQNQSSRPESLQITRRIRQQIMEQSDLSTAARNVKVITDDKGAVTLRGPVQTAAERQQLEQIARNNAQGGQVDNQLVVKSDEKVRG